jgi:Flp pilus assembly pilin Flp
MLNLVDKYSADSAEKAEDGVVAIEYVLVAGLVAAGVAVVFLVGPWDTMATALENLFT